MQAGKGRCCTQLSICWRSTIGSTCFPAFWHIEGVQPLVLLMLMAKAACNVKQAHAISNGPACNCK